ncbi:MAG TPA: ABC transporter ATP-binding protein/permease [Algoriphagus sp.]|uniref:peptidase domain-containing ABC transporter n=3 Tax=Algoriphagus TaxID=246875 RepID=UPI000C57FDDD|nr:MULTISPECIES: ATP-binding cassette domain-containing protein [unclassified Algoriphagus]MAL16039.1 ABC transporter ATP-binding protein/permease [Algoriphagus sp.]HCD87348.1 ABC transporter ATP-binding protein/permease [Algoriphagus sp.]HCH44382.1 ABC transporter ATP-binding protein/permease [Algoriphagus sp.]|tara:strand:+ start:1209 stop:2915 length:1707 start_codon:yes stop_codon:yes gene_type:complete
MATNSDITPIKRFFRLLKEEKSQVYSIYFYAVLNGLITLTLPLGIQAILNFILGGRISTSWIILVLIVAAGVAFGGFLQISQLQIMEKLQQRIFTKSGLSIAYRLPRVKAEILHGQYGPELVNRFFDTVNLQKGLSKILIDFSTALLQVIFGLLLLSVYHPTFILFGIALFVILGLIFYITGPRGMETAMKESSYKYETAYWLEEIGRTMNTFKLVGNTRLPILRADKLLQFYVDFRSKHFAVLIFQYKIMIAFKVLIVSSLLVAGSLLLINDQISIGQFVAAEVIIVLVVNSVEKLILSLETVYDTLVATEKLGHVMDLELENTRGTEKVIVSNPKGLKFGMENVVFHPQDSDHPILRGISLTIEPGKKVAVTGKSGSGKSAFLALLSGLYEEYEGKVMVNDLSIDMIQLEKYRSMVGDVLEMEQIFHGTIRENIIVGREYDDKQLESVLELVDLKEYVYQLPNDLETKLQPEGKGLSKRIIQSILVARALIGKPKAIIMENALLHLYEDVKNRILDYLIKGDWTLILVTKDEEAIKRVDEIIVMDQGKNVFQGNHEGYLSFTSNSN